MNRPSTLVEVAQAWADRDSRRAAMAAFYVDEDRRQYMLDPEPEISPEDPVMNAYLGAVAEHLARRWDLRIPRWCEDPRRFLKHPRFTSSIEDLKALLLVQNPLAFRRSLIFVEHEPLTRPLMPKQARP